VYLLNVQPKGKGAKKGTRFGMRSQRKIGTRTKRVAAGVFFFAYMKRSFVKNEATFAVSESASRTKAEIRIAELIVKTKSSTEW
jgi:hypothetical protein